MTDYKTIKGKRIKFFTSDLDNEQAEGQIFYQDTDNEFKAAVASAAWSSGGPLTNARRATRGAGAQAASFVCGGGTEDDDGVATEEYNGTGFAAGGSLNQGRNFHAAAGTLTAGLAFGGANPQNVEYGQTEEYDGSSWTESGDLSQARQGLGGCGTQTAALAFAGSEYVPQTNNFNVTEEYNGTSWTNGGAMNTTVQQMGDAGIQTAALSFGGNEPTITTTEEYDGSSWTVVNSMSTARVGLAGAGIQTSALAFGGSTDGSSGNRTAATEGYDGTSWSSRPNMATARRLQAGNGSTNLAALAAGGYTTTNVAIAEEFNVTAATITAAAWASGGNLNTGGRAGAAGSGIQTASIIAGGGLGTVLNNTESYNGSSWTNLPTLGTARGYMAGATNAPYTATVVFGGATGPGGPYVANSEEYSGSSWAEGNDLNTNRGYLAGFGTQTAGAAAGGTNPGPRAAEVEEYNGTSWSEVNNMPTGAIAFGGCGTQTAGLIIGDVPMKGAVYDGTNWTTIPTLNSQGNYNKVFGTTASAMTCGRNPGKGNDVEEWNGTNWFTQASLATARFNGGQTGTTTAGLVAGSPVATEEFTAETTSINIKTITDS
jgi:hypothetical protein